MEERMVEFASHVIQVASELPRTIAGKYFVLKFPDPEPPSH